MNELTFSRSVDGSLIAVDNEGVEYALPITDQLRAAVRDYTAPEIPDVVIQIPEVLRPKDIQALVRAGADPKELAQTSGIELDHVVRYAAPVMDERAFVAERARSFSLVHDPQAPTLTELAQQRLLERGIDPAVLVWDAVRHHQGWVVRLDFESDDGPARARWQVDLDTRTLTPLNEQARWIGQTPEPDSPIPSMRLLAPLPDLDDDAESDSPLFLLDGLMEQRGLREPVLFGDRPAPGRDAEVLELPRQDSYPTEGVVYTEPQPTSSLGESNPFLSSSISDSRRPLPEPDLPPEPMTPPWETTPTLPAEPAPPLDDPQGALFEAAPVVRRRSYTEAVPPPEPETEPSGTPQPAAPATRSRSTSKRSSVPSWDEIVFGSSRTD